MDEPSPSAGAQGRAQSRCRFGTGEPSPGADVGGASLVPLQMHMRQGYASAGRHCMIISGDVQPTPELELEPDARATHFAEDHAEVPQRGAAGGNRVLPFEIDQVADAAWASPVPLQAGASLVPL